MRVDQLISHLKRIVTKHGREIDVFWFDQETLREVEITDIVVDHAIPGCEHNEEKPKRILISDSSIIPSVCECVFDQVKTDPEVINL